MKRTVLLSAVALLLLAGCSRLGLWTSSEKEIVSGEGLMRVLTIDDPADSLVLRTECADIPSVLVKGKVFRNLAERMVATVTDPSQDGVGIAGPQVGLTRRVVAVQRFDKEGTPFEVYPNIRITAVRGDREPGAEGCLSIPGRRGTVMRYRDIDIEYTSPFTARDTSETVAGFTAVIFQHECDHLDGILYTDRMEE